VGALLEGYVPGASAITGWLGDKAGAWLGNKFGTLLGSGSYSISKNTVAEGTAVPYMHRTGQSLSVCHREYLGDVFAGPNANEFDVNYFDINPANYRIAPWLSNLATQFQEYKIKGMAFYFNSTTSNAIVAGSVGDSNNIGTVIMASSYNTGIENPFPDKATMENTQYTQSSILSNNMAHFVECDPRLSPYKSWYIRTGPVPSGQAIQLYDYAKFAIATVSPYPGSNLGELWVTYDVELTKPILRHGANVLSDSFWCNDPTVAHSGYDLVGNGTVIYDPENSIQGTFGPDLESPYHTFYQFGPQALGLSFIITLTMTFNAVDANGVDWNAVPQPLLGPGLTPYNNPVAEGNWLMIAPVSHTANSTNYVCTFVVRVNSALATQAFIDFTGEQNLQNNAASDASLRLIVTQIDNDVVAQNFWQGMIQPKGTASPPTGQLKPMELNPLA